MLKAELSDMHPRRLLQQGTNTSYGNPQDDFLSFEYGFLPGVAPLDNLPETHQVWDQIARDLPTNFAEGNTLEAIASLPDLGAEQDSLPDSYLCRAACLLGIFAHAYVRDAESRNNLQGGQKYKLSLPDVLEKSWIIVSRRLGRPGPCLAYRDLFLYNWKLRDTKSPRVVENLDLLVPAFGNEAERIFYMTMAEVHTRSGELIGASIELYDGVNQRETGLVRDALQSILEYLNHITFNTLLKIDPNPNSKFFVDPIIWSKTVAPFAAPTRDGELGLSGGGSPVFHLLDAIFERRQFSSQIGQELKALAAWFPPRQRQLFDILSKISLKNFVHESGSSELMGLYRQAFEAYAGERGWFGVHRLKTYGYMELGFKAGRTTTNGGFEGEIEKRSWEELDDSLDESRKERLTEMPNSCPYARRGSISPTFEGQEGLARKVRLNFDGQGLRYQPGDHMGVFAFNSDELIARTLRSLNATGKETIKLSPAWVEFLNNLGVASHGKIELRSFLGYAQLRPVLRSVAKILYRLSNSSDLKHMIENREEDQFELWNVLEMANNLRFDVRRLLKAEPWQADSISRIVPPSRQRLYSISSAVSGTDHSAIDLTVGRLSYQSNSELLPSQTNHGVASGFLTGRSRQQIKFPVGIIRPTRFSLPGDPERPVAMFAGGTGISPFRAFWQARASRSAIDNWLFFGTRSESQFYYKDEITAAVKENRLSVHAIFSRCDRQVISESDESGVSRIVVRDSKRGYIDKVFDDTRSSDVLWQMLLDKNQGGKQGYFYICGHTGFAHTVMQGLGRLIARRLPQATGVDDMRVKQMIRNLIADGRLKQDVFTTFAPVNTAGVLDYKIYDNSEIAKHNNPQNGYWMVIQGQVYDVSEFAQLHPGGHQLLFANAGLDATRSYEKAEHHLNPEVHSMLDLYKIGRVRRIDCGEEWGIAVNPANSQTSFAYATARKLGTAFVTLEQLFKEWVRFLFSIVEIENSLHNNYTLATSDLFGLNGRKSDTALHAQLLLEVHGFLCDSLIPDKLGFGLHRLWCLTTGLCDEDADITFMENELRGLLRVIRTVKWDPVFRYFVLEPNNNSEFNRARSAYIEALVLADKAFLREFKEALIESVAVFEEHQRQTLTHGGDRLVSSLESLPRLVAQYIDQLQSISRKFESHSIHQSTGAEMEKIAVIGTGIQGTAIVNKLLEINRTVYISDLHADRMQTCVGKGAIECESAGEAIRSAEITLVIVNAGSAQAELLCDPVVQREISSQKVIVQMGNSSVEDTQRAASAVRNSGGRFVEAVIMGPTDMILQGNCPLAYTGDDDLLRDLSRLFDTTGDLIPVGTEAGQAAAFNIAVLTAIYSSIHGFALASAMIEKSSLDRSLWLGFVKKSVIGNAGGFLAEFIDPAHFQTRDYSLVGPCQVKNSGASEEINMLAQHATGQGLSDSMLTAMSALHRRAMQKNAESDWTSFYDELFG